MGYNALTAIETGLVTTMVDMFKNAVEFNQDIKTAAATWDVVNVLDMTSMFEGATKFTNTGTADPMVWGTSKLVKTNSMFKNAANFNEDVFANPSGPTKVTDMASMFEGAAA